MSPELTIHISNKTYDMSNSYAFHYTVTNNIHAVTVKSSVICVQHISFTDLMS